MGEEVRSAILGELSRIENEHGVRVLYACESGSRAWGFASPDSDYDVRFIYTHSPDWYLSVNTDMQREVIERTVEDLNLDLAGWDLKKALCLFHKSNPPLMEWLQSPIVYREIGGLPNALRTLSTGFYSVSNASYHYFHMARGNFNKYLSKSEEDVWTKKYFYVLRPLLCVDWLQKYGTIPPVIFGDVRTMLPDSLQSSVDELLRQKLSGAELRHGQRVPDLHEWLSGRLSDMPVYSDSSRLVDWEQLNELFRGELATSFPS